MKSYNESGSNTIGDLSVTEVFYLLDLAWCKKNPEVSCRNIPVDPEIP